MKKTLAVRIPLFITIFLFACAAVVSAHPPQALLLSFDPKTSEVTATITHTTSNPDWHFVQKIEFFVNDVLAHEHVFSGQTSSQIIYSTRLRNVQAGQVVSAKAYCNRSGMKTSQMTVSQTSIATSPITTVPESRVMQPETPTAPAKPATTRQPYRPSK